jgi:type IV pilus assembly PilX-like protein
MKSNEAIEPTNSERGTALVMVMLIMALMLTLTMGISLTSISEMGVSNTYTNQTKAFQAAEAGLYHAITLVRNFTNGGADPNFTTLLAQRGTLSANYLTGNNPFTDSTKFASGSLMIDNAVDGSGQPLLNGSGNPLGHQLRNASGNPVFGAYYSIHVIDDEKTSSAATVKVPNFNPVGTWEDGNASVEANGRVVVYSTGTYGSSSVTLEGWIGFVPYPALVAQKDITVDGNAEITGSYGGVHSNEDLTVSASSSIEQTATAVGNYSQTGSATVDGFHGGGQAPLYIPKFITEPTSASSPHIQNYIVQKADVILLDPGFANGASRDLTGSDTASLRVKKLADSLAIPNAQYAAFTAAIDSNTSGNVDQTSAEAVGINRSTNPISFTRVTTDLSTYGWNYSGGDWNIPSNSTGASGHTFYVVGMDNYDTSASVQSDGVHVPQNGGNVSIQGNAGSLGSPIEATILATGSITVSGNPYLTANLHSLQTPELPPFVSVNLLMVAVEDIQINGDVGAGSGIIRFSGICFSGEQVYLSGNGEINGQVIALDNPNVHGTSGSNRSPVDRMDNEVTGSFSLDFDGGQAVGKIKLMSWRQIKQ